MNNNWAIRPMIRATSLRSMLVRKLVECVSKGGNMILNAATDANGRFPAQSCEILDEIGAWMAVNSESIYHCGSAGVAEAGLGLVHEEGRPHLRARSGSPRLPLALTGLAPERIGAVRRLADGSEVIRGESWVTNAYEALRSSRSARSRSIPIRSRIKPIPCSRSNIHNAHQTPAARQGRLVKLPTCIFHKIC